MKTIYRYSQEHVPFVIYSKFPSIGFKYGYVNEHRIPVLNRLQISFNSADEFQSFIAFLRDKGFNIKDESTTTTNYIQPSSQFIKPAIAPQPAYNNAYNDYLLSQNFGSQPSKALDFSALSQPMPPLVQQENSTNDYLSQILNPKRKEKDFSDMTDDELKGLLNDKLRDMVLLIL